MKTDQYGQLIFNEDDLIDQLMQGQDITTFKQMIVDSSVSLEKLVETIENPGELTTWVPETDNALSVVEFDAKCQQHWYMPEEYQSLDIAEHVLKLCQTPEQLQRVGQELLLYQEKNLFDLLRYLKYLVDLMTQNKIIWGVGRGSSVASYVLYLLGVHRIDSLYYNLDPEEFLR